MELFTMLAAVNNDIFKKFVSKYTQVKAFANHAEVVFPNWYCKLAGTISSNDSMTELGSLTWGGMFGWSQSPWDYSAEFRFAMTKLETMGLEGQRYLRQIVEWEVVRNYLSDNMMDARGTQLVALMPKEEKVIAATPSVFSHHLGKLFDFPAPPVALLNAVRDIDIDSLVQSWRRLPAEPPSDVVVGKGEYFSSGLLDIEVGGKMTVQQVMAALVRDLRGLKLNLRRADNISPSAVLKFGFLVSTILCGNPLCSLAGENSDFPSIPGKKCTDLSVTFSCGLDARFIGICCAVTGAPQLERLSICRWINPNDSNVRPMSRTDWGWLGYTLSNNAITELKISGVDLAGRGLKLFKAAMETRYPEPLLQSNSAPEYGYVTLCAGTKLQTRGWGNSGNTLFSLVHEYRCRALYDPFTMENEMHVIIPGLGVCGLNVKEQQHEFVRDAEIPVCADKMSSVQSLKIVFSTVASGEIIQDLLQAIGKEIKTLSIEIMQHSRSVDIDLCAVALICPLLENLRLDGVNITKTSVEETLCGWNMRRLTLVNVDSKGDLATCLSCVEDGTNGILRKLVQLRICLSRPLTATPELASIVDKFHEHNGVYIPVVKAKFPIRSKVAFISCTQNQQHKKRSAGHSRAIYRMNESVLELILKFAATAEQRSIRIFYVPQV
ncbi:hypothetical protein PHMEG_00016584 [Phytophthora megakarya]|uniref:Uncharacterized protein n=1 Tax=Phytophthora megakarya TaxID=4795 RepID=A0A225VYX7_9STRA|nr:hypothetical protein PHMEG_00016584 [Phytophthora megakarya]